MKAFNKRINKKKATKVTLKTHSKDTRPPIRDALKAATNNVNVVRPEDVANQSETIPYELLTRIGPRVQRIFIGEFN